MWQLLRYTLFFPHSQLDICNLLASFWPKYAIFEENLAFFPIFRMNFNSPIQFADQDECKFLMIQIDNSLQSLF